jgi:hypothetical protein
MLFCTWCVGSNWLINTYFLKDFSLVPLNCFASLSIFIGFYDLAYSWYANYIHDQILKKLTCKYNIHLFKHVTKNTCNFKLYNRITLT